MCSRRLTWARECSRQPEVDECFLLSAQERSCWKKDPGTEYHYDSAVVHGILRCSEAYTAQKHTVSDPVPRGLLYSRSTVSVASAQLAAVFSVLEEKPKRTFDTLRRSSTVTGLVHLGKQTNNALYFDGFEYPMFSSGLLCRIALCLSQLSLSLSLAPKHLPSTRRQRRHRPQAEPPIRVARDDEQPERSRKGAQRRYSCLYFGPSLSPNLRTQSPHPPYCTPSLVPPLGAVVIRWGYRRLGHAHRRQ